MPTTPNTIDIARAVAFAHSSRLPRWAQNCFWYCSGALILQTIVSVTIPYLLNGDVREELEMPLRTGLNGPSDDHSRVAEKACSGSPKRISDSAIRSFDGGHSTKSMLNDVKSLSIDALSLFGASELACAGEEGPHGGRHGVRRRPGGVVDRQGHDGLPLRAPRLPHERVRMRFHSSAFGAETLKQFGDTTCQPCQRIKIHFKFNAKSQKLSK